MTTRVIDTPGGIDFSGFYFPEIKRNVLTFLRQNKERLGLTDENDFEVHVNLLSAFALVGHLANTRLDTVATELLIDSAALLESVKRLLRLMGIELKSAGPAKVDAVLKLSEVTSINQTSFIPQLAEFASSDVPAITYEDLTGSDQDRTDQLSNAFGLEETEDDGGSITLAAASTNPDVLVRSSGTWATDVLGQHLFLEGTPLNGGGEFRVSERINATDIRLITVPSSKKAAFVTETLTKWSVKKFTADAATSLNSVGPTFVPWATVAVQDMIFVSHKHVQWNQIDVDLTVFAAAGLKVRWEYFDAQLSAFVPKLVTDLGGTLEFDLETLLGTTDGNGALVTVTFLPSGKKETITSVFSGGKNKITTTDLLGQTTASVDVNDYLVQSDWAPFDNVTDGSSELTADGAISFDHPQSLTRRWRDTEVNLVTGFWIRGRVVAVGATGPTFDTIKIDQGDQFMFRTVTQGETIGPQIVGSSTGLASINVELPETPFIDDTELIEVDEGGAGTFIPYTRVASFLNSSATARHYVRETNAQDRATVRFGDGIRGKIPPAGNDNIQATYRVGGEVNGNIGPDTMTTNADGVTGIADVNNPRAGFGWRIKDGGDDTDLERIKREGPAELRTRKTASTTDDVELLAKNDFTDADGVKAIVRAFAEEEKFGIKTIGLLVVGAGGTTLSRDQLDSADLFFNGDRFARPPVKGALVMNHKLTSLNFEPRLITVVATVVWPNGDANAIRSVLLNFLTPLKLEDDGSTFVWDFGGLVSFSKVHQLIHRVDPAISDVKTLTLNGAALSVSLTANQLPTSQAASIQINILQE
ncbi:hypothetical protein LCGC14_0320520 [marine sediment metagenome]|uniref:Baseplate protein J-like domain-containing protein n=1 Tax=marine sediment metagenome TaxID=412755 RepID=A0A0F9TQ42_9ZZZZ